MQWTLNIARAATTIDRLVVSTEDSAIAAYARLRGVEVHNRPAELAEDDIPIADVVTNVVNSLGWEHDVVVLQPTCPTLKPETIDRVIAEWRGTGADWAITATPAHHLFWKGSRPLTPRVNSQFLANDPAPLWQESGAVQLFTEVAAQGVVRSRTIIGIDPAEALDIDTFADLAAARQALGRRTILFHVVASDEKGSGHLRRCLQLSDALAHHDVRWDHVGLEAWAWAEAERHGVKTLSGLPPGVVQLDNWGPTPDLAVIDSLEAADKLAPMYAAHGIPTVVFEPDGARFPARFADLVIDEFDTPELTILRPEFLCLLPYEVRERADRVLVSFGGTDPAGMNQRVERILKHGADALVYVADRHSRGPISEMMRGVDLVVTSQGRTVHEAAAVGVPCLSIAVNERESRHARLDGVVYLGLSACVSDSLILDTVNRLLGSEPLRREMSATSSKAIDGKGLGRVVRKIEDLLA